jgi:hypothetical protein
MPGHVPAVKVVDVCGPEMEAGDLVLSVPVSAQVGDDSDLFMRGMTYGGSEDIVLER